MRVFVCDRDSHHGEVGTLTGEIASVPGTPTERQAIAMTPPEARIAEIREAASKLEEGGIGDTVRVPIGYSTVCRVIGLMRAAANRLHEQAQEIERLKSLLDDLTNVEMIQRLKMRAEAAESALTAAKQEIARLKESARIVAELNNPALLAHMDQAVEVERLRAEIERWKAAQGWRPIETAPKDGTLVLVYYREGGTAVRRFAAPRRGEIPRWIDVLGNNAGLPSHWMPLPSAPELTQGHTSPPQAKE